MRLSLPIAAAAAVLGVACASGSETEDTDAAGTGGGVITGVGSGGGGMTGDGLPLGAPCADDAQCASNLCEEVFLDLPDKVCVERCREAADCPEPFFCEAINAGAMDGYCIPQSPAHCMPCDDNADCGYLSELCIVGPDDDVSACHVDCSLGGNAACPSDYTCEALAIGNATREVCTPNEPKCEDALGGFCDNVTTPIPCSRNSADGTCTGERSCDAQTERFSLCSADTPVCKASCDDADPAGCMLQACGTAADTAEHCGMCDNACPGVGTQNASPSCDAGMCSFSCAGESYDVDNNTSNGCEATDAPTGNHTSGSATNLGTFPCTDGSSNRNIAGSMHSDQRMHVPPIAGFDAATGSAPDHYTLFADGGICQNEVVLTLSVSGTGNLACYRLTVITNNDTYTCATNASGSCNINEDGTGAYSDNTDIDLVVERTCAASSPGSVTYTVTGHL